MRFVLLMLPILTLGCKKKDTDDDTKTPPPGFDLTVLWEADLDKALTAAPTVGFDGTLYGAQSNGIVGIDADTGSESWQTPVGRPVAGPICVANDGNLYVPDGTTLLIVGSDGSLVNSVALNEASTGSPAIGSDGAIVVPMAGAVAKMSTVTQSVEWSVSVPGSATSVVVAESGAIAAYSGGRLTSLSSTDGTEQHSGNHGDHLRGGAGDNGLLLASDGVSITGIDALGEKIWRADVATTSSTATLANGNVYVGTPDGVTTLSAASGKVGWTATWGGAVTTVVLDDDLGLYALDDQGVLAYVDRTTGDVAWTWDAGAPGFITLTADALLLATGDGLLRAIDEGLGLCGDCTWPRNGHDNRGTARMGAPIQ